MIRIYGQVERSHAWLTRYRGHPPLFVCVLGFTETGLIPGISAAGATPADRTYTAIADAEFLYYGPRPNPTYPLPPLHAGASPVFISRAVTANQHIPVYLFNAGLPHPPTAPCIDLGGMPARCLTQGKAMDRAIVDHLLAQGLKWGERLAKQNSQGYVILSECVVGGTTTALAALTGLGWDAAGKVNSSHPTCNHQQKWDVVNAGLSHYRSANVSPSSVSLSGVSLPAHARWGETCSDDPLNLIAAIGDPMQIAVAGMAIAASRVCGVLLAGGTQMLAVYSLIQAIARFHQLSWTPNEIIVGTTRWVAEDPTGDTIGLAQLLSTPLVATQLSFATSRYNQLRAYEDGYVKEGVGAGGCAIAAHLYGGWEQAHLLNAIETLADEYDQATNSNRVGLAEP